MSQGGLPKQYLSSKETGMIELIELAYLLFYFVIGVIALFLYFLPTIIASYRQSSAAFFIFLVNLFGGWTIVLWIFAIVWAFRAKKESSF